MMQVIPEYVLQGQTRGARHLWQIPSSINTGIRVITGDDSDASVDATLMVWIVLNLFVASSSPTTGCG
jgi:hypothetical protein